MQSTLSAFKGYEEKTKQKEKQTSSGGFWTLSEDLKLRELVAASGPRNWKHIGKEMQGRTDKTCRSRWFNFLDPRINKGAFSDEEEQKLLEAHRELGSKWSLIARRFNGRTGRAVKNHLHKILERKFREQSTSYKDLENTTEMVVTPHVLTSQPSSSSSSEVKDTTDAIYYKTNVPSRFIDFLGVGES